MVQSLKKAIKDSNAQIQKAKSITLLTHRKPDGDGISACAALSLFLEKKNKKIETIYPTKAEFKFKRKPKNILINKHKQKPDLLMILDTANYERCYYPESFKNIPVINIDHHISNKIDGTLNFIDQDASSTCEILFNLLNEWNRKSIDKNIAECLLFGILYDTQVFQTQATTATTLEISSELIKLGADLYKLKTELISNKNPQIIKLWGKVLSKIKLSKSRKAAWVGITQKDLNKYKLDLTSLIGFNNFLSQIAQVDLTLFFYETEDKQTKISLRSKKTDVNKLAEKFGGGGHKNFAVCTVFCPVCLLGCV